MYLRPIFLGIFSFLILTVGRGEMISPLKIPLLMRNYDRIISIRGLI